MPSQNAFADLCLQKARQALIAGEPSAALEWIEQVPPERKPPDLCAEIHYSLAKERLAKKKWNSCAEHLREANRAAPDALFAERLRLIASRHPLQSEKRWLSLTDKVDPATKLSVGALGSEVAGIWACGAYRAWGPERDAPWSRLLRMAKDPPENAEERDAILALACGYLCRFILERTPLLGLVDAIASIPANPGRYTHRMMSLPDELARAAQQQLSVPFVLDALHSNADRPDLRGLGRSERRRAVSGSMSVGDLHFAAHRNVLLIDDVVTTGETMLEGARLLRAAGARSVYAIALCHTEG